MNVLFFQSKRTLQSPLSIKAFLAGRFLIVFFNFSQKINKIVKKHAEFPPSDNSPLSNQDHPKKHSISNTKMISVAPVQGQLRVVALMCRFMLK
jgi:hypothetical protein